MVSVLSRYSAFFTSSFWPLRHLYSFKGAKIQLNNSFLKNFSNRFLIGNSTTSGNLGLADNSGYQLKLVLRKLYANDSRSFVYLNSTADESFTDFVYFFFYKQSKYWYTYRVAYSNIFNLRHSTAVFKSSNFLDISILDRVYFQSSFQYGYYSKSRFNLKSTVKLNWGQRNTEDYFRENLGIPAQPFLLSSACASLGAVADKLQSPVLYFNSAHLLVDMTFPFFQLKTPIIQFDARGCVLNKKLPTWLFSSSLKHTVIDLTTFTSVSNELRNSFSAVELWGQSTYFFWWSSCLLHFCTSDFKYNVASLPLLLASKFSQFLLSWGIKVADWAKIVEIKRNWILKPSGINISICQPSRLSSTYTAKYNLVLLNRAYSINPRNTRYGVVRYQFLGRTLRMLLALYFKGFGDLGDSFNFWRFNGRGRAVVTGRSNASLSCQKITTMSTSSELLFYFFTFFTLPYIGAGVFFTDNLPRLAVLLVYFRRFLKNFDQYNSLLLTFWYRFLGRLHLNSQPPANFFLISCKNSVDWGGLFLPTPNLSAADGAVDISYKSVGLMRLGGSREHQEFFSLYLGQGLARVREISPLKSLPNRVYSLDTEEPLNLEFFDTLTSKVFAKTFVKSSSANLMVAPSAFDIDTSLSFSLDFRGTWFFNEFDVVDFLVKGMGRRTSDSALSAFSTLSQFLPLSLGSWVYNLKKKRRRRMEQFGGGLWVQDPRQRVWSPLSPEVLAHRVLIFRPKPVKLQWQPKYEFRLKASLYWYVSLEFNFFQL